MFEVQARLTASIPFVIDDSRLASTAQISFVDGKVTVPRITGASAGQIDTLPLDESVIEVLQRPRPGRCANGYAMRSNAHRREGDPMLTTRFTELIGCTVPIQQAPMNIATPELAAAVAGAGGLGMLATWGAQGVSPEQIATVFDALPREVPGAYGANFVLRFVDPGQRDECLRAAAERARVVECFYSDPDPEVVAVVHEFGALASWQVGSREEALAAQDAGCDFIVAQGSEAGGHVRGTIGLLALLDEVLEAVEVPVVAAGGIGSGRAMAAALAAGADGRAGGYAVHCGGRDRGASALSGAALRRAGERFGA